MLVFGPDFPEGVTCPYLTNFRNITVVSFGKDYTLKLPVAAAAWTDRPPPNGSGCILTTDAGTFVRALIGGGVPGICYIDLSSATIYSTGAGVFEKYAIPPGILAFATDWQLMTNETEPRKIFSFLDRICQFMIADFVKQRLRKMGDNGGRLCRGNLTGSMKDMKPVNFTGMARAGQLTLSTHNRRVVP